MPKQVPHAQELWPAGKSLAELEKHLAALQPMRGGSYQIFKAQFQEWQQLALIIVEHAFGQDSQQMSNVANAGNRGVMRMGGVPPSVQQSNYESRVEAFNVAFKTAVASLRLNLPEAQVAQAYGAGDPYAFYLELRTLIRSAETAFWLVDAYLDQTLFDLYMHDLSPATDIRVLSQKTNPAVRATAQIFANSRPKFQLRESTLLHDRLVFVDSRCWVIGQSIKDAAVRKPTYMVEIEPAPLKLAYEALWSAATVLVQN